MGQAPSGDAYNSDGEGWPLVSGASDFGDTYPAPKKYTREASKLSRPGDIVLGIRATIGEKVLSDGVYCLGRGVAALRPRSDLDGRYLWHWLSHVNLQLVAKARGATFKQVTRDAIGELEVTLPPLREQRRIAAILDRADSLRAKRRQAIAQIDTLAQSIFLDMFGAPPTNQERWGTAPLGTVATFVGGGTPSRACPEYFSGTICWATSKDMKSEFLDDTEEHITEEAVAHSATKLVPVGTILVVVKSKILAHRLPVAVARVPTCFGQDLKGIRPNDRFEVGFVATSLRLGARWLLEKARGINTEGLTLDHLRAFPVLTPPLDLQREFVARTAAVGSLRCRQQRSLAHLDEFFASLQDRAFRGEL
jgi:type I restriction enzyme S subunit